MTLPQEEPLACLILRALADESLGPRGKGGAMSLPRLGKRLGQGASVLMRQLTLMSDASVGGQRGPGWVRVVHEQDRWLVSLTEDGVAAARQLLADEVTR